MHFPPTLRLNIPQKRNGQLFLTSPFDWYTYSEPFLKISSIHLILAYHAGTTLRSGRAERLWEQCKQQREPHSTGIDRAPGQREYNAQILTRKVRESHHARQPVSINRPALATHGNLVINIVHFRNPHLFAWLRGGRTGSLEKKYTPSVQPPSISLLYHK